MGHVHGGHDMDEPDKSGNYKIGDVSENAVRGDFTLILPHPNPLQQMERELSSRGRNLYEIMRETIKYTIQALPAVIHSRRKESFLWL
jgi:hypothetical protein